MVSEDTKGISEVFRTQSMENGRKGIAAYGRSLIAFERVRKTQRL